MSFSSDLLIMSNDISPEVDEREGSDSEATQFKLKAKTKGLSLHRANTPSTSNYLNHIQTIDYQLYSCNGHLDILPVSILDNVIASFLDPLSLSRLSTVCLSLNQLLDESPKTSSLNSYNHNPTRSKAWEHVFTNSYGKLNLNYVDPSEHHKNEKKNISYKALCSALHRSVSLFNENTDKWENALDRFIHGENITNLSPLLNTHLFNNNNENNEKENQNNNKNNKSNLDEGHVDNFIKFEFNYIKRHLNEMDRKQLISFLTNYKSANHNNTKSQVLTVTGTGGVEGYLVHRRSVMILLFNYLPFTGNRNPSSHCKQSHGVTLFESLLRSILAFFGVPNSSKSCDRLFHAISLLYASYYPNHFISEDAGYVLAYAFMMLSTVLHNPAVPQRMSLEDWLSQGPTTLSRLNESIYPPCESSLPDPASSLSPPCLCMDHLNCLKKRQTKFLTNIYYSIKRCPIVWRVDEISKKGFITLKHSKRSAKNNNNNINPSNGQKKIKKFFNGLADRLSIILTEQTSQVFVTMENGIINIYTPHTHDNHKPILSFDLQLFNIIMAREANMIGSDLNVNESNEMIGSIGLIIVDSVSTPPSFTIQTENELFKFILPQTNKDLYTLPKTSTSTIPTPGLGMSTHPALNENEGSISSNPVASSYGDSAPAPSWFGALYWNVMAHRNGWSQLNPFFRKHHFD